MASSAVGWLSLVTWQKPGTVPAAVRSASHTLGAVMSAGALAADFLLQTQGFAALLVFLAPAIWGWQLLTRERIPSFTAKLVLYLLSVVLMAGALSSLPTLSAWPLHHGFGGMLGDVLIQVGTNLLGAFSIERATMLSGIAFFAAGSSCALASMGVGYGDVAELIKRTPGDPGYSGSRGWLAGLGRSEAWAPRRPDQSVDEASGSFVSGEDALDRGPAFAAHPGGLRGGEGVPLLPAEPTTEASSQRIARRFAPIRPGGPLPIGPAPVHRDEPAMPPHHYRGGSPQQPAPAYAAPPVAPDYAAQQPRRPPPSPAQQRPLGYTRPSLNILKRPATAKASPEFTKTALRENAAMLETVLADFSVKGQIRDIKPGPVVTLFEFEPARGVKSSRVIGLADDIARNMSAVSVRVAVVPGRNVIGIELPNVRRETVYLRDLLEHEPFRSAGGTLPLALGKGIGGEPVVADLARMPHLLVAGTTGSGKSVGVNAMILSLLYKLSPETCRFIMIDPKMLELSVYNGIPHLLCPVVTDPQKAVAALNWVVREMEERYQRMARLGVRNIEAFNHRIVTARQKGEPLARVVQTGFDPATGAPRYEREDLSFSPIPFIVVVVDEFADIMMVAGKEIESAIQRLAQMARAAGIHLIMATQRPSVDVITGTIKANFPTRISFKVTSKVDSRTILTEQGAEQLLGSGDMLFSGGSGQLTRVHGPFVSDGEVEAVVQALRQMGPPRYVEGITEIPEPEPEDLADPVDDLYERAVQIVITDRKASTSYIQRRLAIGYNRAADIIERMESAGLIGPADATGRRDVLAPLPDEQPPSARGGGPAQPAVRRPLPRQAASRSGSGGAKGRADLEPRNSRNGRGPARHAD